MNPFVLALRNILRNRRRSLASILTMVVGLASILLFGGYRSNILYGSLTGFVQYGGHLQIQRQGYFSDGGDNPSEFGIRDYSAIMQALQQAPELKDKLHVVTPTLQLGGLAGNFAASVSRSVMVVGFNPAAQNKMMDWNEYQVKTYAPKSALEGQDQDAVIVGTGVARKLRLCHLIEARDCKPLAKSTSAEPSTSSTTLSDDLLALSAAKKSETQKQTNETAVHGIDQLELLASSKSGAPNVSSVHVIKAENKGIKAIDDIYMAMHLEKAQKLIYGAGTPEVTAISIQLQRTEDLEVVRKSVEKILAQQFPGQDLAVLDYMTINPIFVQTNQFMDSMFGFITMLIAVIVLFTVSNTMSAAVIERTQEIGTLRAIGSRRSGIRRIFLAEASLLALISTIIGTIVALIIAYLINHSGWTWTPPGYSYAYLILVRVAEDPVLMFKSIYLIFAVCLISAWVPANRAARMEIVDALRHA